MLDFIRIACAVNAVRVGDVSTNVMDICKQIAEADELNIIFGVVGSQGGNGLGLLQQGLHGVTRQIIPYQKLKKSSDQQQGQQQNHRGDGEDAGKCTFHKTSNL